MDAEKRNSGNTFDFTRPASTAAMEKHQVFVDRTLDAMRRLEETLAAAATGRERAWLDVVYEALQRLDEALAQQTENADDPQSALSEIERIEPRLAFKVQKLRKKYHQLKQRTTELLAELDPARQEQTPDYAEIRQQLEELLTSLRNYRAGENDLFFEAYETDVGVGD